MACWNRCYRPLLAIAAVASVAAVMVTNHFGNAVGLEQLSEFVNDDRRTEWRPHFAHSVNNDPIVGADLGVTLAARRAPTILQSSILRSFRMRAISWSCLAGDKVGQDGVQTQPAGV